MITFDGPEEKNQLPELLEGYLYGLGEVCHTLFGKKGEVAMYSAIGSYFLKFLKQKLGIAFIEENPWQRYCSIIKVFTSYGFYSHVELNEVGPNKYWMLETNQYAGGVWEEQGAWERGTPPCPLWSIILHSLSEINQTIILDNVSYNKECNGYESTFHFEKILKVNKDVIEFARNTLKFVMPMGIGFKLKNILQLTLKLNSATAFVRNAQLNFIPIWICMLINRALMS